MGLRFRKSLRIAPGVRLNFTGRGVSTTLGPRGATVNLSSSGARGNVGIPGTGLSYSQRLSGGGASGGGTGNVQPAAQNNGCVLLGIIGFIIFSAAMCSKDDSPSPTSSSVVNTSVSTSAVAESRYVSARALNCRAEPTTSGAVIGGLVQNDKAEIVEQSGTWSKIRRDTGDCWVASSFLAAVPVVATGAAAQGLMSAGSGKSYAAKASSSSSSSRKKQSQPRRSGYYLDGSCPCSGSKVCIGPRGGRYCITSGGNKRYGV